jgi:branched-chain amino acid transport system ATP-binding protein
LASPAVLEVRDLHSFYGNAHVVCGASLTVGAGEVVALLGRNGMGKTTLIRSIMGLSPPLVRGGDIRWRGETLVGLRPHAVAARRIAIVPQGRRLFGSLTVFEHMTMLKSRRATKGWTVDRIFALFPRLAERRSHLASQLSGGERQMLAVARAQPWHMTSIDRTPFWRMFARSIGSIEYFGGSAITLAFPSSGTDN